ncbi:hypothetical protein XFF6992_480006 [Xanthomonas citri pv. fuscans]|nr:hypothetical protein XFF6992_480006 [Xanthomonas citri pv. fuscans]
MLGNGMYRASRRLLRAVRTHLTTARYVLLAALKTIPVSVPVAHHCRRPVRSGAAA